MLRRFEKLSHHLSLYTSGQTPVFSNAVILHKGRPITMAKS